MKRHLLVLLCLASTFACADDAFEASYFGRVDLANAPPPEVTRREPLRAKAGVARAVSDAAPIYLHVRPGHEERWAAHCREYAACDMPVLFVKESWYRNVYLPHVGAQDGREQRYRDMVRVERTERQQRRTDDE